MTQQQRPTSEEFEAITELADVLTEAKLAEARANSKRVAIEAKIAALIPGKEEGQRTINLADKRKVVVERGLIYAASADDVLAIEALFADVSLRDAAPPVEVKSTRVLDVAGYKWYKEHYPEIFKQIAEHVNVKPKKTSVSVKFAKK